MSQEEKRWGSWRPFSDWTRWEEEVGKRFDDLFERGRRWWPSGFGFTAGPPIDVYEENEEIVVRAELPGMDKNEIELSLAGRSLTIKGEKKQIPPAATEREYYRNEISYGTFSRVIELPQEVHADRGRAMFERGVLEVRLPKTEPAKKSTKIDIP